MLVVLINSMVEFKVVVVENVKDVIVVVLLFRYIVLIW